MDEQIIRLAASSDADAFRDFVERCTNAVYGTVYGIVGDFHI